MNGFRKRDRIRFAPSAQTVTVQYTTDDGDGDSPSNDTDRATDNGGYDNDGTAVAGADFQVTKDTLTFVGNQTLTFTVPVMDDKLPDGLNPQETVNLALFNPTNAALGLSTATLGLNEDNGRLAWQNPTFGWSQTYPTTPLLSNPGPQINIEGDTVSLPIYASDANPLTYDAVDLPPGLSINSATGVISGKVDYSAAEDFGGSYNSTVIVANTLGGSTRTSFAWTITPSTQTPVLTTPADQTSAAGASVSLQITTTQPHGQLIYTADNLPPGVNIDSNTGLISGTIDPSSTANTPYAVTVTAAPIGDPTKTASQTFNWSVTASNAPLQLDNPGDQSNTVGDAVSLQLSASAGDNGTLSYTASGLPAGLTLDPVTGLISGTLPNVAASATPSTVTVTVSDGGNNASQTFNWSVGSVGLSNPGDQSNLEGDAVSLAVTGSDASSGTLSYRADGLPPGLSINGTTGLISGTVATGTSSGGPYAVTVKASDGTYSASQTFTWTVTHTDTTAVTMTNAGDQMNTASDSVSLPINATDPDGDRLNYSATGLPNGLSIDPFSGVISGTVADDAVSATPYAVTVTADDGNGQTVSQSFNWTIGGATLTGQGGALISAVEGTDTGTVALAAFTTPDLTSQASGFTATVDWGDGSSDTGTITGSNGSFAVAGDHTYLKAGSFAVTVGVTDSNGASITVSGTATVTDAPLTLTGGFQLGVIGSVNGTLATFTDGDPNADPSYYTATIDWGDGSGTTPGMVGPSVDGVYSISGGHTYSQNGTYTVTLTLTDVHGGATATTTSTLVVGDLYAGLLSNLSAGFTITNPSAKAYGFTANIDWGDGSGPTTGKVTGGAGLFSVGGSHTYAVDSLDQPGGVYTVTVTVKDDDGDNVLTASPTVAVVRPPMSGLGDNVEGHPGTALNNVQVAEFTVPDATDGVGEFSAIIDWGDGSEPSAGVIQEVTPGLFEVLGSHTYDAAASFDIQVGISQNWSFSRLALQVESEFTVDVQLPTIKGPSYVPGNSLYLYTVSCSVASANVKGPDFTVDNAVATKVREGKLFATIDGKEMCTGFYVLLRFANQPAVVHIGMQNTEVGGVPYNPSLTVAVVQVQVKKPTELGVPIFDPATAVGAGNPAGQQPVTIDGTAVNDGFVKVLEGNVRYAGEPVFALTWAADIVLNSVDPKAYSHIIVGFAQHVTSVYYGITYVGGKTLKAIGMEPDEAYLDVDELGDGPYYSDARDAKKIGSKDSFLIASQDAPTILIPTKYQGAWAQRLLFLKTFTLDVVASSTTDQINSLFREATAAWSLNAVGTFKPSETNLNDIDFKSKPDPKAKGQLLSRLILLIPWNGKRPICRFLWKT